MVYHDDWDKEVRKTSEKESWEVVDVEPVSSQVNTFEKISIPILEVFILHSTSIQSNEQVQRNHQKHQGEEACQSRNLFISF